jgi:hypothetical protein
MSEVPSNLIPTRITQLDYAPVASEDSLIYVVYEGASYKIRAGDLLSTIGVPNSRQVLAGTGLAGGGALSSDVTLRIAVGGVGPTQLAASGVTAGTYGSSTAVPILTVDTAGRITGATTTSITVSGYVPVSRQVIAGSGLTGGGPLNADVTLNANFSSTTPLSVNASGSAGSATTISRSDHQHPAINLSSASQATGTLGLGNGGTNASLVASNGGLVWSGSSALAIGPTGTSGYLLKSNGSAEYSWANPTTLDVNSAVNIYGGAANKIPYQTAPNTTAFINAPTVSGTLLKWNGTSFEWGPAGAGTVTSVGLSLPSEFTVTNSPVTTSGTLTATWASPVRTNYGGTGLDASTAGNGRLLIGNGTGFTLSTLTAGSNISITNGSGTISIAAVGGIIGITNDTSTTAFEYPVFANATSGTVSTIYTSDTKLKYKPSTGEFQAQEVTANNGLILNASTITTNYTIASGYNAMSVGPVTTASGVTVTVTPGQRWVVL